MNRPLRHVSRTNTDRQLQPLLGRDLDAATDLLVTGRPQIDLDFGGLDADYQRVVDALLAVVVLRAVFPARMFYAGRRWRVTDHPTRLREPIWAALEAVGRLYGRGFQATDDRGLTLVFDVFKASDGWHVHRAYE